MSALNAAHDALQLTLADTPAFREWCGVGSVDAAMEKIYPNGLPTTAADSHTKTELQDYRPYVDFIPDDENQMVFRRTSGGSDATLAVNGTIKSRFVRDVATTESGDDVTASRNLQDELATIVSDSGQYWSGTAGHLRIRQAEMSGPFFSNVDSEPTKGDHLWFEVVWHWGNESGD